MRGGRAVARTTRTAFASARMLTAAIGKDKTCHAKIGAGGRSASDSLPKVCAPSPKVLEAGSQDARAHGRAPVGLAPGQRRSPAPTGPTLPADMRVAVWDGLRRLVERDPDGAGWEAVYLLQTDHRPDAAAFAEAVVRFWMRQRCTTRHAGRPRT